MKSKRNKIFRCVGLLKTSIQCCYGFEERERVIDDIEASSWVGSVA